MARMKMILGRRHETDSATFSDLKIEYVDGVTEVEEKTLPPGAKRVNLSGGNLGAWRAHVNVIRKIFEENITSALILEDDSDWDIRIKSQLRDFARASRLLVQPLTGATDHFLDPTYPEPAAGAVPQNFPLGEEEEEDEPTTVPTASPYGDLDRRDVLWLGRCGMRFPQAGDGSAGWCWPTTPTVPEPQHIDMQYGGDELQRTYPAHARVVSRPGARRLRFELGVRRTSGNADVMLRSVCDGRRRPLRASCLTVRPQLFQRHRPVGSKPAYSDISDHGDGYNERAVEHAAELRAPGGR